MRPISYGGSTGLPNDSNSCGAGLIKTSIVSWLAPLLLNVKRVGLMLGYFDVGEDFERPESLDEKSARTLPWDVRRGRVGVSKMGPRLIVGVFCPVVVEAVGTNVPPELSVRRRFCEA